MPVLAKQKLNCVLVHGWAMNSAVWQPLLADLPDWLNVTCVDLPGHGSMADVAGGSLHDIARLLSVVTRTPALWLGWSLGGLAVLQLARDYPERVAGLFMVACNPSFVRRDDWSTAVETEVFSAFAEALDKDMKSTIRRFLALQVTGERQALKTVRELQRAIESRGPASRRALHEGLDLLQQSDLRHDLIQLGQATHWHLGECDTLVPVALADALIALNPAIEVSIAQGAAHAPFLSHPHNFLREFIDFASRIHQASHS